MRNAFIVGLAVVCAALVLSGPTDAQNIKTVQVTGVVDVGNFPAVQQVAGAERHFLGVTQNSFRFDQGIFAPARACHIDHPGSRPCTTAEIVGTVNPPVLPAGTAWVLPSATYFWFGPNENLNAVDLPTGVRASRAAPNLSCEGFNSVSGGLAVDQDGRFIARNCEGPLPVTCCGF